MRTVVQGLDEDGAPQHMGMEPYSELATRRQNSYSAPARLR